ncbi:Hypothetical predicted protein [Lecanosticta acicola]|uniref:Clavaminate synthase-like protein n=1 Tax=Lecanosticta acicola TaxID=111012 RepID=A0AAI9E994_9PEZI|nr:Hypothetical predicted protein [Lecanosticta acicola]
MAPPDEQPTAVTVSLQELKNGSVSLETLEQAFGPNSLGIIIVRNLPDEFASLRRRLLSLASYLAALPEEELRRVERPDARYNIGWSCGKEKLSNGQFDTFKGSYYVNPVHDSDLERKARELYPDLKDMTAENAWPDESVLPGFRDTFLQMCSLIVDVAALVAKNCDRYGVAKLEGYQDGTLEKIVKESISTKARLLHYFPPPAEKDEKDGRPDSAKEMEDGWCGTHQDLGALTGLTSNMFVDESLHPPHRRPDGSLPDLPETDSHPDPKAGLWIKDRAGRTTQVHIPRDCLAFQTGEALESITRGAFKAVPHFVRGAKGGKAGDIARNTLAVFTQPNLWETVEESTGKDFAGLAREVFGRTY